MHNIQQCGMPDTSDSMSDFFFFLASKVQALSMLYRHEHGTASLCGYISVHVLEITYKAFTVRLNMITKAVVQFTCFGNMCISKKKKKKKSMCKQQNTFYCILLLF